MFNFLCKVKIFGCKILNFLCKILIVFHNSEFWIFLNFENSKTSSHGVTIPPFVVSWHTPEIKQERSTKMRRRKSALFFLFMASLCGIDTRPRRAKSSPVRLYLPPQNLPMPVCVGWQQEDVVKLTGNRLKTEAISGKTPSCWRCHWAVSQELQWHRKFQN